MMIDVLKQAVERAAQQLEDEQAAIAQAIFEMLDADAKWQVLCSAIRARQSCLTSFGPKRRMMSRQGEYDKLVSRVR